MSQRSGRIAALIPTPSRRSRSEGFTLLEVLVAMAILAVAVTAVLQLFGQGLRLARASGEHLAATLLASQKLTEVAGGPLVPETSHGIEGEYRWQATVRPAPDLRPVELPEGLRPTGDLVQVAVRVEWGRGKVVELATLRAVEARP